MEQDIQFTCSVPEANFIDTFTLRNRKIFHEYPMLQAIQLSSQNGKTVRLTFEYSHFDGIDNNWYVGFLDGPPLAFVCRTSINLQIDSTEGLFTEMKSLFEALNECEEFHYVVLSQMMIPYQEASAFGAI